MINPFKYGKAVTGEYFCNRIREIQELISCIEAGQNVFIYSNRRLGKTSLIKMLIKTLTREVIPIYVDVHRASSSAQFLEIYSKSISQAFLTRKEKVEKIANFFSRVIPSFEVEKDGNWKVSFDFSRTKSSVERALEEVYELPEKIAKDYKKRVVVIFDEFQEISQFNGKQFEKKMRSFIQHHSEVCYIFMGSKTHIILEMFSNPDRAFYKSARIYPLPPICTEEFINFICKRFKSGGKKISNLLARKIVNLSKNIPYYVQMLSSTIWLNASDEVKDRDIKNALEEILLSQNELFYSWHDFCSPRQRAVLSALVKTDEIFSQDTRLLYNLGSSASVQTALIALMKNGLVSKDNSKYHIIDPFFQIWLERNMAI
jgi:hypothetical protein